MLLYISFKDMIFYFFAKKAGFGFNREQIEKLVNKRVIKFISKLIVIRILYRIAVWII